MKNDQGSYDVFPIFVTDELSPTAAEIDMRAIIWQRSAALRPNLNVTIRRVKSYTAEGTAPDTFATELECLGKTLSLAPCKLESNAEWLLNGWIKVLDPIMSKYETQSFVATPKSITDAETLIQAVLNTTKYKETHKD